MPRNPAPRIIKRQKSSEALQLQGHRLEDRRLMAISASFTPGTGELTITGDQSNNTIEVSRDASGGILVNQGLIAIQGGVATVSNTVSVSVFGQDGQDTITLNEAFGVLPSARLFGGNGDDVLVGGSSADQLFGQAGNDRLNGRDGSDSLFGGLDHDTLVGGQGTDQVFGESGNDRLFWNSHDGSDLMEGGDGRDTIRMLGGAEDEEFVVTANGTRVRVDRLSPASTIDFGSTENLRIHLGSGDDQFSATGNLSSLVQLSIFGGDGRDTILGGNGNDHINAGLGDDFVDGSQGNDTIWLGAGHDIFGWDPGDGSDVVHGGGGSDQLRFNGSNIGEVLQMTSQGHQVRMTRNIGNVTLSMDGMERFNLSMLGGTDTIVLNDMEGSGVAQIVVDLGAQIGSTGGDNQSDTVWINASDANNELAVIGAGSSVGVVGSSAQIEILNCEGSLDSLVMDGLGGEDSLSAANLSAGVIQVTLDGGDGHDILTGSLGGDILLGGGGRDQLIGRLGPDVLVGGADDDHFQWFPGDGNDILEGQGGLDQLLFFGSNADENFDLVAQGNRVQFSRNVASVLLDLDDIERLELRASGGKDQITLDDLTSTDLIAVELDLRGVDGTGDGAADVVTVHGTQGADTFGSAGDNGGTSVFGLHIRVNVFFAESGSDRLVLNGLGGDDVIDATSLEADGPSLTVNGGLGGDVMLGGEGNDVFSGGDGNDVIFMGAGNDRALWNPGDDDDSIEGQEGHDELLFNGSNIGENLQIQANGARTLLSRNVANVALDFNDVETLTANLFGGADAVTIGDLSGTDVVEVNLNLAGQGGAGDNLADNVIINGSSGDDLVSVIGDSSGTSVLGLSSRLNLTGSESALDGLTILSQAGDDAIDASGLAAGALMLTLDGGDDDDVLIGSNGDDVLLGGFGDDILIGGPGNDVLDGGPGDDIEIP